LQASLHLTFKGGALQSAGQLEGVSPRSHTPLLLHDTAFWHFTPAQSFSQQQ